MEILASSPLTHEQIAQLFLHALERAAQDKARFNRGKQYALSHAISRVAFQEYGIQAIAQGSQKNSYQVQLQINCQPHTPHSWQSFAAHLATLPILQQQWHEQQLSMALLEACHQQGISLLQPQSIIAQCTCPDSEQHTYCKHAIALGFFVTQLLAQGTISIYQVAHLSALVHNQETVLANFWRNNIPQPFEYPESPIANWYPVDSMLPNMIDYHLSPAFMEAITELYKQLKPQ